MNQRFHFIFFLYLAASVLSLPGKPRHEGNPTHENHVPDFPPLQERQLDGGINNVYYLVNCQNDSKVAFYNNVDNSHDPSHQPDWVETTWDRYTRNTPFQPWMKYETGWTEILADHDPKPTHTDSNFKVQINFDKVQWDNEQAGVLAGDGYDRYGNLTCFKDNARRLYGKEGPDACGAVYFCWREKHRKVSSPYRLSTIKPYQCSIHAKAVG
ncbi:uncharacterized protein BDZ99DRAFT_482971 [Mytilinidion resinicola]|uniref:Secreted protein n=1 Tax=Mytilinidion resinicola TaxID=574789 RepID=A0A6A6Y2J2_9PEZI|nr:uncharacterized protein BDZ99DRAFT_482971 [Mytilinidion resinicola]KAF2802224.1 hypothetical protein BDZ99DRAFT_482971 [Mytilinidion resinicola]